MLYSLDKLPFKIAKLEKYNTHKKEIIPFFQIENLVKNNLIHTLYTSDEHAPFFLDEKTIQYILKKATEKFSIDFDMKDFYEGKQPLLQIEKNEKIKQYDVNQYTNIKLIEEEHHNTSSYGIQKQKELEQEKIEKQKKVEQIIELSKEKRTLSRKIFDGKSNLARDFINSKVLAIDFEYFKTDQFYSITEIGIAVNEKDNITGYHFLIQENYQKKKNAHLQGKFNFGETKVIEIKQIRDIIEHLLKDSQYILFHTEKYDMEILQQFGIRLNNTQIVDTQAAYQRYYKHHDIPKEKLRNLLNVFKIPFKNLHNAGNDAYYTLMLLQKMSLIQKEIQQNNVSFKRKKM
jgi:hypothetical protein